MDVSSQAQIGLGAAALIVGLKAVEGGAAVVKLFSGYQLTVEGARQLDMTQELLKTEEWKCLDAESRRHFTDTFMELNRRREALEQEYSSFFASFFKYSSGKIFKADSSDFYTLVKKESAIALVNRLKYEAEMQLYEAQMSNAAHRVNIVNSATHARVSHE